MKSKFLKGDLIRPKHRIRGKTDYRKKGVEIEIINVAWNKELMRFVYFTTIRNFKPDVVIITSFYESDIERVYEFVMKEDILILI